MLPQKSIEMRAVCPEVQLVQTSLRLRLARCNRRLSQQHQNRRDSKTSFSGGNGTVRVQRDVVQKRCRCHEDGRYCPTRTSSALSLRHATRGIHSCRQRRKQWQKRAGITMKRNSCEAPSRRVIASRPESEAGSQGAGCPPFQRGK